MKFKQLLLDGCCGTMTEGRRSQAERRANSAGRIDAARVSTWQTYTPAFVPLAKERGSTAVIPGKPAKSAVLKVSSQVVEC
jgi:hypothetical protein